MRQGQPGVQWKQRHFDGKASEQGQENGQLERNGHRAAHQAACQLPDRERHHPRLAVVPPDDRQQPEERQQAPGQSKQEELDRRIAPVAASPNADQKEQRDQCRLEEDVKQDDVPGAEDAEHSRFQNQQKRVIGTAVAVDRLPAYGDRGDHQERSQSEQPERQAIEAQAELDLRASAGVSKPEGAGGDGELNTAGREFRDQHAAEGKRQQHGRQREKAAGGLLGLRLPRPGQRDRQRPGARQEDGDLK